MVDSEKNTMVYCKFSNTAYLFMKKYTAFTGSSVADFVRQAVGEKIMRLGQIKFEEFNNDNIQEN